MKNNLTTTKSTDLVLKKSKSMLNITNRILSGSKNLTTKSNKDVILNSDVMMINGLMWEKETVEEEMDWYEAMEYAENLRLGGYDDWRLPTMEELQAVITFCGGVIGHYSNNRNDNTYQSSYKEKGFSTGEYWSSSAGESDSDGSSEDNIVDFYYGSVSYTCYDAYVRCVRAGE